MSGCVPSGKAIFGSAPAVRRIRIIGASAYFEARKNGVAPVHDELIAYRWDWRPFTEPRTILGFGSAPRASNAFTSNWSPLRTARCSVVYPAPAELGSAPLSRRNVANAM